MGRENINKWKTYGAITSIPLLCKRNSVFIFIVLILGHPDPFSSFIIIFYDAIIIRACEYLIPCSRLPPPIYPPCPHSVDTNSSKASSIPEEFLYFRHSWWERRPTIYYIYIEDSSDKKCEIMDIMPLPSRPNACWGCKFHYLNFAS